MTVDYLQKYLDGNVFDFSALINDDFFQPVRILFQNKHYVSATKLLYVAIDSIAYVEYGEIKENIFVKWLKTYFDFSEFTVTPEELWEHRNALLHMSNLKSRKVSSGKIRQLVCYVGTIHPEVSLDETATGYYDLQKFIIKFGHACGDWLKSYDKNTKKYESFFKRYDLIASDARMLTIE